MFYKRCSFSLFVKFCMDLFPLHLTQNGCHAAFASTALFLGKFFLSLSTWEKHTMHTSRKDCIVATIVAQEGSTLRMIGYVTFQWKGTQSRWECVTLLWNLLRSAGSASFENVVLVCLLSTPTAIFTSTPWPLCSMIPPQEAVPPLGLCRRASW